MAAPDATSNSRPHDPGSQGLDLGKENRRHVEMRSSDELDAALDAIARQSKRPPVFATILVNEDWPDSSRNALGIGVGGKYSFADWYGNGERWSLIPMASLSVMPEDLDEDGEYVFLDDWAVGIGFPPRHLISNDLARQLAHDFVGTGGERPAQPGWQKDAGAAPVP